MENINNEATASFKKRFEKLPVTVMGNSVEGSLIAAREIADLIREKALRNEYCVLGLAAGSTPEQVYEELVNIHKTEGLSFKNVVIFNTDEFYPLGTDELQSNYRYFKEYLLDSVDILPENVNLLRGDLPKEAITDFCEGYEAKIQQAGGFDFLLIGADSAGQVGANEPGSTLDTKTRLIALDYSTRVGNASDFFGEDNVPAYSISIGIGTIMKAKRVLLMIWGESKAKIAQKIIEDPYTERVPASCLQNHPNAGMIIDLAAAAELTRFKTPWVVGSCAWDDRLIKKAVFWLCRKLDKPILKLTDRDYNDNGMGDLVAQRGPSNKINIKVFNDLQHTITGWPGGKPNADDSTRPERAKPFPKRIVVFSPHPDDDVISMGGTLARLSEHGHEVHVAYQVSGNIAVFDDDVLRYLDFVRDWTKVSGLNTELAQKDYEEVETFFRTKKPGQADIPQVAFIKGAIRQSEARAACRFVNIPEERSHFLHMPFYETGLVKKKPIGKEDIQIIVDLLQKIKPHQIYAAGDMTDPHGTHRVCFQAIEEALKILKNEEWTKDCRVWMYRGAWQEWDVADAEMSVPLSPAEAMTKRLAIFKHQSQKDRPLFPGTDPREFWQRAEQRNAATAVLYDKLGMAEYQAIELFVQYHF